MAESHKFYMLIVIILFLFPYAMLGFYHLSENTTTKWNSEFSDDEKQKITLRTNQADNSLSIDVELSSASTNEKLQQMIDIHDQSLTDKVGKDQNEKTKITAGAIEAMNGANPLDGCRYVYLDVGANMGVQVRKLYEPHLYPKRMKEVSDVFDIKFGDPNHRSKYINQVCAVGFELDPIQVERLTKLEKCYNMVGFNTKFHVPVAIANRDNDVVTGVEMAGDLHYRYVGSYVVNKNTKISEKDGKLFKVPTLNLARYIMEVVRTRKIPEPIVADGYTPPPPSVVMKLDIEGSEYEVLTSLLLRGAFCTIDTITIEYHRIHESKTGRIDGYSDSDIAYAKNLTSRLIPILAASPRMAGCNPTKILEVDDEEYASDRLPRPYQCEEDIPFTIPGKKPN